MEPQEAQPAVLLAEQLEVRCRNRRCWRKDFVLFRNCLLAHLHRNTIQSNMSLEYKVEKLEEQLE